MTLLKEGLFLIIRQVDLELHDYPLPSDSRNR